MRRFQQKILSAIEPQTARAAVCATAFSRRTFQQQVARTTVFVVRVSSLAGTVEAHQAAVVIEELADEELRYGTFIGKTFHQKCLSSEEPFIRRAADRKFGGLRYVAFPWQHLFLGTTAMTPHPSVG